MQTDVIITGDARQLIKDIPDGSVDLIWTDPPYLQEFIPLYGWLSTEAVRVLKPTGFLAMYIGCYHLEEVITLVAKGGCLEYFMELILFGGGMGSMMWNRRVIGRHKSIMLYRPRGGLGMPRCNIVSVFNGSGQDKRYHAWGQDEASARYYIDCLTKRGDVVYDPFTGGVQRLPCAKFWIGGTSPTRWMRQRRRSPENGSTNSKCRCPMRL